MSDDDKRLSETQRWMSYARRDLLAGQVLLNQTDNFNTQICFQAQQAAEKAIKAGIVFLGAKPQYIHDLDRLRDLLPSDWCCYKDHPDLSELTQGAVDLRYPGEMQQSSLGEAKALLQQAEDVYNSIRQDFEERGLRLSFEDD